MTEPSQKALDLAADLYVGETDITSARGSYEISRGEHNSWPIVRKVAAFEADIRAEYATPDAESVGRLPTIVAEAVNSLLWDEVYAAARKRCLRDMTGGFYDEHLAREIADQLARKMGEALTNSSGGSAG